MFLKLLCEDFIWVVNYVSMLLKTSQSSLVVHFYSSSNKCQEKKMSATLMFKTVYNFTASQFWSKRSDFQYICLDTTRHRPLFTWMRTLLDLYSGTITHTYTDFLHPKATLTVPKISTSINKYPNIVHVTEVHNQKVSSGINQTYKPTRVLQRYNRK